jgi:hypothetical protein
MGDQQIAENLRLERRLHKITQMFLKRREGCMDLLDFLCEHLDHLSRDEILRRACLNPQEDIDDTTAFEILGIPLPQKKTESDYGEEEPVNEEEVATPPAEDEDDL